MQLLEPMDPAAFVEQTWERYQLFNTPQPMIDYAARWLLEHLPTQSDAWRWCTTISATATSWSDPNGVVAVLDWEVAHIGDPMRDLGWICTNSWRFGRSDLPVGGFGEYADLFRGYESVSGTKVDPGAREVLGSVRFVLVGGRVVSEWRSTTATGPTRPSSGPAIGRRSSECQVDCVNLLIPGAVDAGGGQAAARRRSTCRAPTNSSSACAISCATT